MKHKDSKIFRQFLDNKININNGVSPPHSVYQNTESINRSAIENGNANLTTNDSSLSNHIFGQALQKIKASSFKSKSAIRQRTTMNVGNLDKITFSMNQSSSNVREAGQYPSIYNYTRDALIRLKDSAKKDQQ